MQVKVAIDCMGGDHGAHVTVPAALEVARGDSDVSIILVGLRDSIERELERHGATVLVDAPGVGRSKADAPEIDGVVRFEGARAGEFARVLVDRADEHDLYGRLQ